MDRSNKLFYDNDYLCDGNCYRQFTVRDTRRYTDAEVLVIAKAIGWLIIGKQAFCPNCVTTAAKISKAQKARRP